jgi:predicted NAD/FAD-binding protein
MLFRFYRQHGLLALKERPRWQTVVGGSHSYVKAFLKQFKGNVRTNAAVRSVARTDRGVSVTVEGEGSLDFDKVVIACHGDEAFGLLADPTPLEKDLLEPWKYQLNTGYLHSDEAILPPNRRAWASWNYVRAKHSAPTDPIQLTYHMNRLQGFTCPADYFVSLNVKRPVRPERIHEELSYTHPIFTNSSLATQGRLRELSGQNHTYYCGSYHGYGFHEDAVRSAVEVGRRFGIDL